jgi:hypothetical protein
MSKLEELRPNASVQGILPNCLVSVVNTQWFGSEALELTYKEPTGKVGNELLYRHDEERFKIIEEGRPWSLDGAGALFREGKLHFEGRALKDLLIEAIRYGEQPEVRARLTQVVDNVLDKAKLQDLLEERALAHDAMDVTRVRKVREEMERAEARRLQPFYIESFFLEAFKRLGGTLRQREPRRYEVTNVPAPVRNRDRLIGVGEAVLPRYERIAFEKSLIAPQGEPLAAFVCPGHPLLDAAIDLTLERHRDLLRRGTILVDELDAGTAPRLLFFLEHTIQDAALTRSGQRRVISRQMLYVEIDADGKARHLQYARISISGRSPKANRTRPRSWRGRNAGGYPAISRSKPSATPLPRSFLRISPRCERGASNSSTKLK